MRGRAAVWLLVMGGVLAASARAQAELEIEQIVNADVLTAGAVVEFVVTVRNTGAEPVASGAVGVSLSPGLGEPPGTAPFFSQGSFDPAEGRWVLGELLPGASAVLSMPAQVSPDPLPPCVYSRAQLDASEDDPDSDRELAFATLRMPGVERCVDLEVDSLSSYRFACESVVWVESQVWNRGPDAAHDVWITVTQQPEVLPDLAFTSSFTLESPCLGGLECVLNTISPGEPVRIWLVSARFENKNVRTVAVEVAASSTGTELEIGNEAFRKTFTIDPLEACEPIEVPFEKSGGSCFIATAAYGSVLHPRVVALRRFRDRFLLTNAPGRRLVAAYYRASPPMATFIAERPAARALTRAMLWPLVLSVEYPLRAIVMLLAGVLLWRLRRSAGWRGRVMRGRARATR